MEGAGRGARVVSLRAGALSIQVLAMYVARRMSDRFPGLVRRWCYGQPIVEVGPFQRCDGTPGTLCTADGTPLAIR